VTLGILDRLRSLLGQSPHELPERRLAADSEAALSNALHTLVHGGRGWASVDEVRHLFSTMDAAYAFGQEDKGGKAKLDGFATRNGCTIDIMPDGRVYFTRKA
jgi:hypothetical protein